MFTSLSSYIWGGSAGGENAAEAAESAAAATVEKAAGPRPPRDPSPFEGGDEWVLVGSSPAPGNLAGALEPLRGLPSSLGSSPASSSSASEAAGDEEEEEDDDGVPALAGAVMPAGGQPAAVRLPSAAPVRGHHDLALLVEARAARAGQAASQRASGKALSSKALKRSNKAVMMMAGGGKPQRKQLIRTSMNLKMAGANKNLKQC